MIKLTQTVQKGGCAAKVAATELRKILDQVKFPTKSERLMVDGAHFDDAAIFKINDQVALVQTLDFFTPILDTPYLFGQVASANALSDVYAMGGTPTTAMAILAFPVALFDHEVIVQLLQGCSDLLEKAGVSLAGGHSIDDDTLKFGLSVTGEIVPSQVWSNQSAKAGDDLILTKKLGTGTVTAALKRGLVDEQQINEIILSMCQLNKVPQMLSAEFKSAVHSATDITGFGLLGHTFQMAKASHQAIQIRFGLLPVFDLAYKTLEQECFTKAHRTNAEYVKGQVTGLEKFSENQKRIMFDPQTSGGLLLSVDPNFSAQILSLIKTEFPAAALIGKITGPCSDGPFLEII